MRSRRRRAVVSHVRCGYLSRYRLRRPHGLMTVLQNSSPSEIFQKIFRRSYILRKKMMRLLFDHSMLS